MAEADVSGYHADGEYKNDGVTLNKEFPPEHVDRLRRFEFRSDDVLVATYPKAGTTWMQELLYLILTEGDFQGAKEKNIMERGPFLELCNEDYNGLELVSRMRAPRQMKTHLQYKFFKDSFAKQKPRVIVVMRNLKDNLVSYYHFHRSVQELSFPGSFSQFFDLLFKNDRITNGSWFDFNLGWWQHRHDPSFLFVTYEAMKRDVRDVIMRMSAFLDKELPADVVDAIIEHTSFGSMKKNNQVNYSFLSGGIDHDKSAFMRKGVVGDWANHFTKEQVEYCDQLERERLAGSGIQF